uniref:Uncharacterized protein n=1 Tax=Lepeophtheirus salmonis TaxID=72036 RepID=A0A0K2V0Q6_LEPSM
MLSDDLTFYDKGDFFHSENPGTNG